MSSWGALHRFLFERLGRGLDDAFWRSDLPDIDDEVYRTAQRRGLVRELAGAPVPCGLADCAHDCVVSPAPAGKAGYVVLPCPQGVRRDRVVERATVTPCAVGTLKLLATLCRSNGIPPAAGPDGGAGGRVYPLGTAAWASDALLCLAIGVRRRHVAADIAAALTLPARTSVVLLPPLPADPLVEPARLRDHGVNLFSMDAVIDWESLVLDRHRIIREITPDDPLPAAEGVPVLDFDVRRKRALLLGHELELTPIQFGYLLTLARTAGTVVPHDDLANRAYAVAKPKAPEAADPGQNKRWISETLAACEALVERGLVPNEVVAGLITAKRGVGYVMRAPISVRVSE